MTIGGRAEVSPRQATGALIALSVAAFCYVTTELLPIGLLTLISADLRLSPSRIGLLVTGYAAVVVVASIPLTQVTRRVPRRWLLAGTLCVFAGSTLMAALAPGYSFLLAARLVTGLTQAMFWSVVIPAAAGLFPAQVRGRVVARLAIGTSLAPVVGVPAGTWLGQQAGWRAPLLVMAAVSLAAAVTVTVLVPTVAPREQSTARGSAPHRGRYAVLVIVTILGVTGFLTTYTYITPFLLDVSRFPPVALGPLLLSGGVAGLAGTLAVGAFLDRRPRAALVIPLAVLTAALFALFGLGVAKVAAVAVLAVACFAFSALPPAIGARTLHVAPGSTDLASAGTGSAFNLGIAAGSLLGGVLVADVGPRSVALVGALLTAAAFAVMASESRLTRPRLL